MDDSIYISLRFALYIDLMLLFGLALFGLYSLRGKERADGAVLNFGSLLVGAALIGILLSMVAMLQMAKTMSGVSSVMELHHHILQMMLMDTDVGLTWMVRIASLTLAVIAATLNRRSPALSLWLATLCGAIALATLAWTGHGAMDEGSRRYLHFTSDIVHLLGAGSWLGALAAFALLLRSTNLNQPHRRSADTVAGSNADWFRISGDAYRRNPGYHRDRQLSDGCRASIRDIDLQHVRGSAVFEGLLVRGDAGICGGKPLSPEPAA